MTKGTTPRTVQKIAFRNQATNNRQAIVLTPHGGIDHDYYEAKARKYRAEAFATVFGTMIRELRNFFVKNEEPKGAAECNCNCHSST